MIGMTKNIAAIFCIQNRFNISCQIARWIRLQLFLAFLHRRPSQRGGAGKSKTDLTVGHIELVHLGPMRLGSPAGVFRVSTEQHPIRTKKSGGNSHANRIYRVASDNEVSLAGTLPTLVKPPSLQPVQMLDSMMRSSSRCLPDVRVPTHGQDRRWTAGPAGPEGWLPRVIT